MKSFKQIILYLNLAFICMSSLILVESCNGVTSPKYIQACAKGNFVKAHVILGKIRNYYITKGLAAKKIEGVSTIKGYQAYVDADIYIFREEVAYLLSINNADAEDRIIKLIMETPMDGTRIDAGEHDLGFVFNDSMNKERTFIWLYYNCIQRFNQKCDIVLELSIMRGKKSLASRILSYYKQTMHIDEGYIYYDVFYDYEDRDAAQKRFDEAVENGILDQ